MSSEIASTAGPGDDAAETTRPDIEIDDSLIPIFTSSATEDDEGSEDDDEDAAGEVGENNASQSVPVIKRKNKSRGIMARGPTALPKNRGNGFEGAKSLTLKFKKKGLMLNDNRVFCGSAYDSRRSDAGETRDLPSVRVMPELLRL